MASNFVQGAMGNALKVQADPNGAMSNSQRAFASGGDLALKLTSLLDQEEKMRTDRIDALNKQIMVGEELQERNRSNLVSEGINQQNANTSSGNLAIRREELKYIKDKELGMVNAPTLSTTAPTTVGTQGEVDQAGNIYNQLAVEAKNLPPTLEGAARQDELKLQMDGVKGSIEGLVAENGTRLQTVQELNQNAAKTFKDIDTSNMSDGQKVGLKLELKRQVEEGQATLAAQAKRQQDLRDAFAKIDYKAAVSGKGKQETKDFTQNLGRYMASNVIPPGIETEDQYNQYVSTSVQNLDSNGLTAYPGITKEEQNKYKNSFISKMKNKDTSGLDTNRMIQWSATILNEGDMSATELETAMSGQVGGEYSNIINIAKTLANPEITPIESKKYDAKYVAQDEDLEETWDVMKQSGWFDDLFSTMGGQTTVSEGTFQEVIEAERKTIGTDFMSNASSYVPAITDSIGQRDTIDTGRVTKSLLEVFDVKVTPEQEQKISDYEEFIELRYELKDKQREDKADAGILVSGSTYGIDNRKFDRLQEIMTKNPDFVATDKKGNPTIAPIINVVSEMVGTDKAMNVTDQYKKIAYRGGPRTNAEKDFFGYIFMTQVGKYGGEQTASENIQEPIMDFTRGVVDNMGL